MLILTDGLTLRDQQGKRGRGGPRQHFMGHLPSTCLSRSHRQVLSPHPTGTHTPAYSFGRGKLGRLRAFSLSHLSISGIFTSTLCPLFPAHYVAKALLFLSLFFPVQGSRAGPALSRTEFLLMLISKGTFLGFFSLLGLKKIQS